MKVTLYYEDYYNFSEKVTELGIPDTDTAYETFKYPPCPEIEFEWDEETGELTPIKMYMGDETYPLIREK